MASTAVVAAAAKQVGTPVKKTPQITESPGNWKHPRLAEITRRQSAAVFTEANVRTIAYNFVALGIVLVAKLLGAKYPWLNRLWVTTLPWSIHGNGPADASCLRVGESFRKQYAAWVWLVLYLVPLINIGVATMPLFRKRDVMNDIPLTPAQRTLLGLPPSSVPATPGSVYSTPPRYSRTPSMSGSVGSNKSYASSPLSGRGSPAPGGKLGGSPYSPAGSPLLQKAVTGGLNGARRSSFGSGSPLGAATGSSLFKDIGSTPSPTAAKRSSVGLNSKWLYERGRRSSGGANWLR